MKFHCLLPVREEADVIAQSLNQILTWADSVFVFDTGSVDDTWGIVEEFAAKDSRVRPVRKDSVYFNDTTVRAWLFNEARKFMKEGDWFLRVDADEFHHISPPEFVKNYMRRHETIAYHQYYNFHLLKSEVDGWYCGEETLQDRGRPIAERRRYYTVCAYAEPRLCRYRSTMQWAPSSAFPFNAGYVAVERLPIRHYPHRDPVQLERRCRLRALMMADERNRSVWTNAASHHWTQQNWREFIMPDNAEGLKYWQPGVELPLVHLTNHLKGECVRLSQRFVHAFCLPLFDRVRPEFPPNTKLQPIPVSIAGQFKRKLSEK